jgi:hypothetical protein
MRSHCCLWAPSLVVTRIYILLKLINSQVFACFTMVHLGEKEQDPTAVGVEVRTAPLASEPWVKSYGVIDGGGEVMRAAWPKLEHIFSVRRGDGEASKEEQSPRPKHIFKEPHRLPNDLLNNFPVDLLTIEQGSDAKPTPNYERRTWGKLISRTEESESSSNLGPRMRNFGRRDPHARALSQDGTIWITYLVTSEYPQPMSEERLLNPAY